MKTLAINVKEREKVGKSNTRSLRNQDNVPCVLYGGEKQVTFYAHENEFRKLVYTLDIFIVELTIDGEIKKLNKDAVSAKARELFLNPKTPRLEVLMRAKGSKEAVPERAITEVKQFKNRLVGR